MKEAVFSSGMVRRVLFVLAAVAVMLVATAAPSFAVDLEVLWSVPIGWANGSWIYYYAAYCDQQGGGLVYAGSSYYYTWYQCVIDYDWYRY